VAREGGARPRGTAAEGGGLPAFGRSRQNGRHSGRRPEERPESLSWPGKSTGQPTQRSLSQPVDCQQHAAKAHAHLDGHAGAMEALGEEDALSTKPVVGGRKLQLHGEGVGPRRGGAGGGGERGRARMEAGLR